MPKKPLDYSTWLQIQELDLNAYKGVSSIARGMEGNICCISLTRRLGEGCIQKYNTPGTDRRRDNNLFIIVQLKRNERIKYNREKWARRSSMGLFHPEIVFHHIPFNLGLFSGPLYSLPQGRQGSSKGSVQVSQSLPWKRSPGAFEVGTYQ